MDRRRESFMRWNALWLISIMILSASVSFPQENTASADSTELVQRVKPSVALILIGEGAGRLSGLASGLCVGSNGILLTAYHVVKNAREVQVRLANGETYDNVQLLGFDARRDVAALRISASDLPLLSVVKEGEYKVGEDVFVVSNPEGMTWSVTRGTLSAYRPADEVQGAGSGYHLFQFSAPVSPGSSGGVLVDTEGRALGLVTGSLNAGQNLNFAVPLFAVLGLASGTGVPTEFGAGANLNLPQPTRNNPSHTVANADPNQILRSARTIFIKSRTTFFTPDLLARALFKEHDFSGLNLKIVNDPSLADLVIQIDRPLFTYDFTYTVLSPTNSLILASGKVIAFDGATAAPKIAKNIIKVMASADEPKASSPKAN